jgi:hypothetical protein
MIRCKLVAAGLLSAAACTAEKPVATKWDCVNLSSTGAESAWTILVHEAGGKLSSTLTDGDAEILLSNVKLQGSVLTFGSDINGKRYAFDGKVEGTRLEGKYAGEEARGKLRCTQAGSKPSN